VLAGQEIGGGSQLGIGASSGAGECIGIDLAVVYDFFGDGGFVVERRRGRADVRGSRRSSRRCACRSFVSGAVSRSNTSGIYAFNRRFRNSVGIFTDVVFDVIFILANLIGPNRAPILEVNDVGSRGQRPDNLNDKH